MTESLLFYYIAIITGPIMEENNRRGVQNGKSNSFSS